MSTSTANFGLVKAELTDPADITALNPNWDKIDNELNKMKGWTVEATSADGEAYTATVDGVKELYTGLTLVIIPNKVSATSTPTLNVNGLGAKMIRRPLTTNTSATVALDTATWLVNGKPVELQYDGTFWKAVNLIVPSASNIYGSVPITSGGTGATSREDAIAKLSGLSGTPKSMPVVYNSLADTGIVSSPCTTEALGKAMPVNSTISFSNSSNTTVYLTDAPVAFGFCTICKGFSNNYITATYMAYSGEYYVYKYHETNSNLNGWNRVQYYTDAPTSGGGITREFTVTPNSDYYIIDGDTAKFYIVEVYNSNTKRYHTVAFDYTGMVGNSYAVIPNTHDICVTKPGGKVRFDLMGDLSYVKISRITGYY